MQCSLPIAGHSHAFGGCIPSAQAMACRSPGRLWVLQVRIAERSRDRAGLAVGARRQSEKFFVGFEHGDTKETKVDDLQSFL